MASSTSDDESASGRPGSPGQGWKSVLFTMLGRYGLTADLGEFEDSRIEDMLGRNAFPDHLAKGVGKRFATELALYRKFEGRVEGLLRQLRIFSNAVAQLGSSATLMAASADLYKSVSCVLLHFRHYAEQLLPPKPRKDAPMHAHLSRVPTSATGHRPRYRLPDVASPLDNDRSATPEKLPDDIQKLAEDTVRFLTCLKDFAEFHDEALKRNILAFRADLEYWAASLAEFSQQLAVSSERDADGHILSCDIARYICGISSELGEHLDAISNALVVLADVRVPTVRAMQDRYTAMFVNLTTISTFFSAVTATTLQFSYQQNVHVLDAWVNAFWYISLVFSVSSAVNSLVGLTWMQAIFRSPAHRVPWWLRTWIKRAPLIFLVISIASFSAGFALFTFSSGQRRALGIVVAVFTATGLLGIALVSSWLLLERWVFLTREGQVWAHELIQELTLNRLMKQGWDVITHSLPKLAERTATLAVQHLVGFLSTSTHFIVGVPRAVRGSRLFRGSIAATPGAPDIEPGPSHDASPAKDAVPTAQNEPITSHAASKEVHWNLPKIILPMRLERTARSITVTVDTQHLIHTIVQHGATLLPQLRAENDTLSVKSTHGTDPRPKATRQATAFGLSDRSAIRISRMLSIKPELKSLTLTRSLVVHRLPVRSLAFSPNGEYLATASTHRTTMIKLSDLSEFRELVHLKGSVEQVCWSPDGAFLLSKETNAVNLWNDEGVWKRRIDWHQTTLRAVHWLANNTEIMCLEESEIKRLGVTGKLLREYPFEPLYLHDIAINQERQRIIIIASLITGHGSKGGVRPVRARRQRRIVVYDLSNEKIAFQIPIFPNAAFINLSKCGRLALVGYDDKTPPELWSIDEQTAHTHHRKTYLALPNQEIKFSGQCSFAGKNDDLIVSTSKEGHIFLWDRETATLLHMIRRDPEGDRPICVAWNDHITEGYMLATGTHEGTIQLWHSLKASRDLQIRNREIPARSTPS